MSVTRKSASPTWGFSLRAFGPRGACEARIRTDHREQCEDPSRGRLMGQRIALNLDLESALVNRRA